ncbi:coenzyme Q-binding protein COQ10, mitochondrial isoform X2 [Cotesia typhae]|uniref:coenzyme Q-binding protein COQ10, mitochondrial isoform X2 n=1 Tax=Cotesia typhae TaxID=2053667 RepID=UPI003D681952
MYSYRTIFLNKNLFNYVKRHQLVFKNLYSTFNKDRTKEYEGRKLIGFSMEQIFDVVADVQKYKNFLPFCKKSEVYSRSEDSLRANLVIGFPPLLNESYTSCVTIHRPYFVKAECKDDLYYILICRIWSLMK